MVSLYEPAKIGHQELKNRLVRSATWEGMCDPDGRPTSKLIDYYTTLVRGGISKESISIMTFPFLSTSFSS